LDHKPSSEAFRGTQWLLLEQVAIGSPLYSVLDGIVRFIECQSNEMKCSILLLDRDGTTLRHGAAPSLPDAYTKAIDGAQIGPAAGSCGTAAFRREPVIVEDIATHPYWADYKHLILPHGFAACWSTPILDRDGVVLGTFAMYYRVARGPNDAEREWVRVATHLTAVAISRDHSDEERRQLLTGLEARVEALRQSEERFSAVIGNSPHVGVQWYDQTGRLLFANEASYRLLGWMGLDPIGKTLGELNFPAEEAASFNAEVAEVARTGKPRGPIEFRYTRTDGTSGILLSTIFRIPGASGNPCFVCMDIDITAHRRAEERAGESEKLRALVYSTVSDVIFYLSVEPGPRYRFLSVNPAFTEATGLTEEAIFGRLVEEVMPADAIANVFERYALAIETREPVSWLNISDHPSGKKYGEVKVTPVFDADGHCTNLVGTVHDLTRFMQAEAEQRRLEEQLKHAQRIQALGTLTGGIAHDFNNILTAILAHVDLASMDPKPTELQGSLAAIRKAGQRGADLVRRLLRYSQNEEPRRERVHIEAMIDEVLELLRATTPKSIHFEKKIMAAAPDIDADPTQLHQVMMNLCSNAIQALPKSAGTIEIRVDVAEAPTPDVGLPRGKFVRVSVSDTGSGMDEATLERIFEPFFTTKPTGQGTGLGLSVVHGIMKSHSGTIHARSEPGSGTTFDLYFPLSTSEETSPHSGTFTGTLGGKHIFYVDDDEDLLLLTGLMLRRLGYHVTTFSQAQKMLEALKSPETQVDAVVSDVSMPGMTGPKLIHEVRRLRPNLPAVLVSGYARPEDLEAARELGITQVLSKPNTVEAFAEFLSDLFSSAPPAEA
jgi:PAS domain S-box-containing protein